MKQAAEVLLAIVIVALGWAHGVLYVEGGSMEPALSPGDLIVYRRIGSDLRRGDLVVFEHSGALVVHRVAGVLRGGELRTRGDANKTLDSASVGAESVRGEVLLVLPAGRALKQLAALGH
jgi:signal peptidase